MFAPPQEHLSEHKWVWQQPKGGAVDPPSCVRACIWTSTVSFTSPFPLPPSLSLPHSLSPIFHFPPSLCPPSTVHWCPWHNGHMQGSWDQQQYIDLGMNGVRKVRTCTAAGDDVCSVWQISPPIYREEQLLLFPCWQSTHLSGHSVSSSTTSGPDSCPIRYRLALASDSHSCIWYNTLFRLVKQLVEMPSCHMTTLKLAGNSLQVSNR